MFTMNYERRVLLVNITFLRLYMLSVTSCHIDIIKIVLKFVEENGGPIGFGEVVHSR